jgi:hypothetical protein
VGPHGEDVDFIKSTWFASIKHNPLGVSEAYIEMPQIHRKKTFFNDHADKLMPVIRGLMKTAARPLIYKVWKSTPKAVLALAAVIKLHNAGDPHPFLTLTQLTDLDVPLVFIKRLAWDAGIRDIPGLSKSVPRLMPHVMGEAQFIPTQGDTRYHHHRVGDDAVMVWMDPKVFLKQAPSMGGGYDPEKDEMVQHWAEWLRDGRPLDGLELGGDSGHDGRHRAWGAILAGVDRVPVYVEPDMAEFYVEHDMAELRESGKTGMMYHVTERDYVPDILKNGFVGGWGDVGFGVYFYGNILSAQSYAKKGGWDGHLEDPFILQVSDPRMELVDPHPDWNAADYADMYWVELDEDDEEAHWMPHHVSVVSAITETVVTKTVFHVTFAKNLKTIQVEGLSPRIGKNSKAIGEKRPGVHVFFDWASMEDAATNWDMDWHDDEDEELVVLTLEVPEDWVRSHWETFNQGTGIIVQTVPPSMITAVKRNF